jgi:hypothetical protein
VTARPIVAPHELNEDRLTHVRRALARFRQLAGETSGGGRSRSRLEPLR